MGFFKVNTTEDNIRDYSGDGGNYINKSGIYEVVLKSVIVDQTAKGSQFLNLWLEYNGQEQPIFQAMRLTNNDGSPNLGMKLFTKLCVIAGATDGAEIGDPVRRMVPIGKGGEEKECMVLTEFDNIPVHMRVQMEYSMYDGKIQQQKLVRNFFRYEDKATASEIINDSEEKGKQYNEEAEFAEKISYKDGLTEEDIAAWQKENRSGKKGSSEEKKPAAGFTKRTFGKKS